MFFKYAIVSLLLSACVTSNTPDKPERKEEQTKPIEAKIDTTFIGFGYYPCNSQSFNCGMDAPSPDYHSWAMLRSSRIEMDTFFIYFKNTKQIDSLVSPRILEAIKSTEDSLFTVGENCITFKQDGTDTLIVNKKKIIVTVPIEPCVKYLSKPF